MSVIAQAIADRQSQIDRLQVEIKAVDRRRANPRNVSAAGALYVAALFLAEEGSRRRQQVRRQAGEDAPEDVGRGEESGIGTDDRLLGAAQGRQEVAGNAGPAAESTTPAHAPGRSRRFLVALAAPPALVLPKVVRPPYWTREPPAATSEKLRLQADRTQPPCRRRPRRTNSTPSRPRPASGSAGTGSTAELLVAVSVKEAMSLPARSWSATSSSPGVGSV